MNDLSNYFETYFSVSKCIINLHGLRNQKLDLQKSNNTESLDSLNPLKSTSKTRKLKWVNFCHN